MDDIKERCKRAFATHKAALIQDTDRYLIIDWRREDGSGNYYVNYIVDKKRGSLIVGGDIGDSIATWYTPVNPSKLKKWIYNDIYYYIQKIQCASGIYCYNGEDIAADIRSHLQYRHSVAALVMLSIVSLFLLAQPTKAHTFVVARKAR